MREEVTSTRGASTPRIFINSEGCGLRERKRERMRENEREKE